jgi:Protein of unknown function (DUF1326)
MKMIFFTAALALMSVTGFGGGSTSETLTGDYVEVRSCDVYTGSCVANSEMGVGGREGMLVWSITHGTWKGTALDGLSVIAVVRTEDTLGDVRFEPRAGRAVLIVDARASATQREALVNLASTQARAVISTVVSVQPAPVEVAMGQCASGSCATVKAGNLVEISTRCLGGKDHLCGNEENYYPPLTQVRDALSAYTELAAFRGEGLNATWEMTGKRSSYLGRLAL